jgi:hypothetical protein
MPIMVGMPTMAVLHDAVGLVHHMPHGMVGVLGHHVADSVCGGYVDCWYG